MTRAETFGPNDFVRLVAVRFKPGAAPPILRVPAHHLTDRTVGFDQLGIRWLGAAEIVDHDDLATAARRFEHVLLQRLASIPRPDPVIAHAVAALLRAERPSIAELARDIAWSRQHLAREFRQHVGVSPKQLARTARLHRAIARLQRGRIDLATAAVELGYFDQAHLIRDFRELGDITPRSCSAPPRA